MPGAVDLVAARVRDDGLTPGRVNPDDGVGERRPRMRDVAGIAARQVPLEDVLRLARIACFDEVAREVRPRDEPLARHVLHRAFVRAFDAGRREGLADPAGAGRSSDPNGVEPFGQHRMGRIDSQRDDVQRAVVPAHRKLGSADELDSRVSRSGSRFGKAAHFVMIGQRKDVDAARGGACNDRGRRQKTIGMRRVAVQIVTRHRGLGGERDEVVGVPATSEDLEFRRSF